MAKRQIDKENIRLKKENEGTIRDGARFKYKLMGIMVYF
jgi:hypothetical protein